MCSTTYCAIFSNIAQLMLLGVLRKLVFVQHMAVLVSAGSGLCFIIPKLCSSLMLSQQIMNLM